MIHVESEQNKTNWDDYVTAHHGHPLQLWGWGDVKAKHGWRAQRVYVYDGDTIVGAAQMLCKSVPIVGRVITYIPRGPVAEEPHREAVLDALKTYAKKTLRSIVVTIEPHWKEGMSAKGWKRSNHTILIPHTLILDLAKSEDELLADIASKRRYDIRKSTQHVHEIREALTDDDRKKCLALYHKTAERAGFALHEDDYYHDIAAELGGHSRLIAVWNEAGDPIAFTWFAVSPEVAFELYGGINEEGTKLRANFALKWWCITEMKRQGVRWYDFNGLLNDGISAFKRNFASHEDYLVGTYNYALSPLFYVWDGVLPLAKRLYRAMNSRSK